jgi:phenylalanyl-tRNA synthetase beta subunit
MKCWVACDLFQRLPCHTRNSPRVLLEGFALNTDGELLVRSAKFDEFTKDGRTSYAFRLVFQSMDRTLFDEDANHRMESIYAAMKERGWEVR